MANPRFLVADDDRAYRTMVARYFRANGCDVSEAATGTEALRVIRAARPDVALIDVVMPGLDGLQVMRQVRLDQQLGSVALVAHTQYSRFDEDMLRSIGAVDVIYKPAATSAMLRRLLQVARRPVAPVPALSSVIVVDPDEDTRQTTKEFLAHHGILAFCYADVPKALEVLRGVLPTAIVTDARAASGSATDLVAELRARGITVPVIALTGDARLRGAAGFERVLLKPEGILELPQLVRDIESRRH